MGSQITKLLLQLCLLAAVCHYQVLAQEPSTGFSYSSDFSSTDDTTTMEETTTTEETTTISVCPIEMGKCTKNAKCGSGEGRCNKNNKCRGKLKCGFQNCQKFNPCAKPTDRCCEENPESSCNGGPGDRNCCKREGKCGLGGGHCEVNTDCKGPLICGSENCKDFHPDANKKFNCCIKKP